LDTDQTEQDQTEELDTDDLDAEGTDETAGEESLGDAGKKALDSMKSKWKAAAAEAKAAKAEAAALRAEKENAGKEPDEQKLEAARNEAKAEATAAANKRILKSEIRAAAAGKFADPSDAFAYLNLEDFDVDENGDVDEEAIADALAELLKKKPYLAAQGATVQFDSARGKTRPAGQITSRDQLKTMTPKQIQEARKAGRLDTLLGKKS
jgi:hypothetical protein